MEDPSFASFMLVEIGPNLSAEYLRYTSLPFDTTYEAQPYLAGQGLLATTPPVLTSALDKSSYLVDFADPDYVFKGFFNGASGQRILGVNMRSLVGFINNNNTPKHGVAGGGIFTEYMTVYEGFVNSGNYNINLGEEVLFTVEGASPMASLESRRSIVTSKNYLAQKYPGDTSYDEVYEGSDNIQINWGRSYE